LPVDLDDLDYASFSAHKFYGPKGVGALYIKDHPPEALLVGGGQEESLRSGTLNVPGIVGMGAAAAIALQEQQSDEAHARKLRAVVLENLSDPEMQVNGGPDASPYVLSVSFRGLEGETLLIDIDQAGYAISAGAACSSRAMEPSHVLTALGLDTEWLRGTLRISFGRFNKEESALGLAKALNFAIERMRDL
jgi:cysteine desulfurase